MKSVLTLQLGCEADTVALGTFLAKSLPTGAVVFLHGGLGAGKTTLCRGVITALGHVGAVKSPTYTLVEPYELPGGAVYHFDLYRLGDPEELELLGVRDYFDGSGLALVEWPSAGEGFLPEPDLLIALASSPEGGRLATLTAVTPAVADALGEWDGALT